MDMANTTTVELAKRFGVVDYIVFAISLAASAAIGKLSLSAFLL